MYCYKLNSMYLLDVPPIATLYIQIKINHPFKFNIHKKEKMDIKIKTSLIIISISWPRNFYINSLKKFKGVTKCLISLKFSLFYYT